MNRNYKKINAAVIEEGLFSEYLPKCFRLPKEATTMAPNKNCDLIKPLTFTMSKFNQNLGRRVIYVPEIGSYNMVSEYIKNKNIIKELIEFTDNSVTSFSRLLAADDSVISHDKSYRITVETDDEGELSDYVSNLAKKVIKGSGAMYILRLDIANFYSSIYLHMVPTIILGYELAEYEFLNKSRKNRVNSDASTIYDRYNEFESRVRRLNRNRTNGILTGPILSKIIAEALLCRIDLELLDSGINYTRYMDDYEIFLYEKNDDEVINTVSRIFNKYGLVLNTEKTVLERFPYYVINDLEKK